MHWHKMPVTIQQGQHQIKSRALPVMQWGQIHETEPGRQLVVGPPAMQRKQPNALEADSVQELLTSEQLPSHLMGAAG